MHKEHSNTPKVSGKYASIVELFFFNSVRYQSISYQFIPFNPNQDHPSHSSYPRGSHPTFIHTNHLMPPIAFTQRMMDQSRVPPIHTQPHPSVETFIL
ncbi:hypothetical protein EYC84_011481 [Monilinia fructicola]|uniref:Uncharacterized protein n=1 Tax=Monilinia fructicola TaxID=38448 RepID=A0A5M9J666_MONFR|nr:hypothetical protein EYC84_011481 [Monilinia fructicola]